MLHRAWAAAYEPQSGCEGSKDVNPPTSSDICIFAPGKLSTGSIWKGEAASVGHIQFGPVWFLWWSRLIAAPAGSFSFGSRLNFLKKHLSDQVKTVQMEAFSNMVMYAIRRPWIKGIVHPKLKFHPFSTDLFVDQGSVFYIHVTVLEFHGRKEFHAVDGNCSHVLHCVRSKQGRWTHKAEAVTGG